MLERLRPFEWDDLERLIPLFQACEAEDRTGSAPTAEHLRHQFSFPGFDIQKHAYVLPDAEGGLLACGVCVPIPSEGITSIHMVVTVRPDHRAGDLQDELLRFLEARAAEWQAQTGQKAQLHVGLQANQTAALQLYERNSYRPARYFLELERDLATPIADTPVPTGITVRRMRAEGDIETLHFLVTDSFKDHWNSPDFTVEQMAHLVAAPNFNPDLVLMAFGPNDEPAAVCVNRIRTNYNQQHNTREGEVDMLGVRRPFRRQGLARALLTWSLHLIQDSGMTTATLGVDAENPTGATHLYDSVGFRERKRSIVYQKPVGAAAEDPPHPE
jgi:mycothiol synthase